MTRPDTRLSLTTPLSHHRSGARGSKLRYRTALVSGYDAHSRTLADEIRRAVAAHVVE